MSTTPNDIIDRLRGPGIADYELDLGVAAAAATEIINLRARVEELEKDETRLDWLDEKCFDADLTEQVFPIQFRRYYPDLPRLRAAIDAAKEAKP